MRVDRFFLDFYCAKAKLCVEVDGEQHLTSRDAYRDSIVASLGIETLRIPSLDLVDAAKRDSWLKTIEELCSKRAVISSPLPPSSKTNHFEEGDKLRDA